MKIYYKIKILLKEAKLQIIIKAMINKAIKNKEKRNY